MLSFNKKIRKQQLSERGKKGANTRHSRNRASKKDEPIRKDPPNPMYVLTWDNRVTGKTHTLEFQYIGSTVSFKIVRDGKALPFTSKTAAFKYVTQNISKVTYHD